MSPIGREVKSRQFEALSIRLANRLGCHIDAVALGRAIDEAVRRGTPLSSMGNGWADDTWVMWIKNRLATLGVLDGGQSPAPIEHTTAVLHVGFIFIIETEEMLSRLRANEETGKAIHAQFARSKLASTNEIVRPIDRVASRVSPPELRRPDH